MGTGPYRVLGTDGYGRSDFGRASEFFEVDRRYVAIAALKSLADAGEIEPRASEAIERYEIDPEAPIPTSV